MDSVALTGTAKQLDGTKITGGKFKKGTDSVTSTGLTKFIEGGLYKKSPDGSLIATNYECVENEDKGERK